MFAQARRLVASTNLSNEQASSTSPASKCASISLVYGSFISGSFFLEHFRVKVCFAAYLSSSNAADAI